MRAHTRLFAFTALAALGCASTQGETASASPASPRALTVCESVPEELHEGLLFGEHFEVVSARPLYKREGKQMVRRYIGAELFVPSKQGVTASSLTQAAQCQAASYASKSRASDVDPLAVEGVRVSVKERGAGFVVRISAERNDAARDIARRGGSL